MALHLYLRGRMGLYRALWQRWPAFLLLGLINNAIPHTLILFGQTEIGAGLAAILNATTPIWTMPGLPNPPDPDEKLSPAASAGTLLGLAGTAVLIGPSALNASDIPLWAVLLPVGAAVSYGRPRPMANASVTCPHRSPPPAS